LRETIRTRSSRAILPDFGQTETGYEPYRARKTFQIKPGAEEISDDPVIGGLEATVSTLRLKTIGVAVESASKNRRNPHKPDRF
jgi:beta-phosphoglucomutase-like phosphatase (HAD superfamily)